jgi:hypothetical protein
VEVVERTIDRRIEIILDVQEQSAIISGDWNQLENIMYVYVFFKFR